VKAFAIWGASLIWGSLSAIARFAADRHWLGRRRLDCKVISVGNLQAGGSGKTPLVGLIAREAIAAGKCVAILTRGYRGRWEDEGGIILPQGHPEYQPPTTTLAGDEAVLLHDRVPQAWVGVGRDRGKSYDRIVALSGRPDLVVLDDGFQHWRLARDLDVVAVTSMTQGEVPFRDFQSQLRRAGLVVWTKGEQRPDFHDRPWVHVRYRVPVWTSSDGVDGFWLVTGVADAASARLTLTQAGYPVRRHLAGVDHASYTAEQVRAWIAEAAKSGSRIALTGKDWVKWRELGVSESEVSILEPELEFLQGREVWERVLWHS